MPQLSTSNTIASILSLQVTLFPNKGLTIGYAINHAILDGKSITMFVKAWAHICKYREKEKYPTLLPELISVFDRTVVQDPEGLDMEYLNTWLGVKWSGLDPNPRSLKLLPSTGVSPNLVRATFGLSREDIKKLRERVLAQWDKAFEEEIDQTKPLHLSTFVLIFAYTVVCMVKAKGIESNRKVQLGFSADCRACLDPPLPTNYFGNCVTSYDVLTEAEALMGEKGVAFAAIRLSEVIKGLEQGALEGAKEMLAKYMTPEPGTGAILGSWVNQIRSLWGRFRVGEAKESGDYHHR